MTQPVRITSVEPTIFFTRQGDALRQLVRLHVSIGPGGLAGAELRLRGPVSETLVLGDVGPGTPELEIQVPDQREPARVTLELWAGGRALDTTEIDWQPARHWEVHMLHYSHHDLGYTDLPLNVLDEHAGFIDDVVRFCDETEDWPEDARFRWLAEQAYSVMQFAETRPADLVERLMRHVRAGRVEVTALMGNMTMELCGHEELIRLLYPAFKLAREHGFDISSAMHNDIPGFAWGLSGVLDAAGVRYFCPGIPAWYFGGGGGSDFRRRRQGVHPLWDEEAVVPLDMIGGFWWEAPTGARVLVWHDLHGSEWQPTSYENALRTLPVMLAGLQQRGYPYDLASFMIRGGHRDNAPASLRNATIAREWNNRWAYPRLITSTEQQYLGKFERRWGSSLKTLRGDAPGTDYSVAATCTPKELAINRNAHDWLLSAEKLATWASAATDYAYPRETLDRAYRNTIFFDEHCWSMYDPGGPAMEGDWSEKSGFAYRAAALAHDTIVKAANRLVDEVRYQEDAYYLTVFNPLAWERTEVVRSPLRDWAPCGFPMHWEAPAEPGDGQNYVSGGAIGRGIIHAPASLLDQPFELVDVSTGQTVPYQVSRVDNPQAARPWAPERFAMGKVDPAVAIEIAFLAEKLPPLGYKTYLVRPCAEAPHFACDCTAFGLLLENRYARLRIDAASGQVLSLYDKEIGRELVDPTAIHPFGRLIVRSSETGRVEDGQVREIAIVQHGPVFSTVRMSGETPGCPRWTEEITLYHLVKRIEVAVRILRDSTPMLELYLPFPFQVESPNFRFEATNSVIEPTRDQLPGSNTDYYAVQHWADVSGGDWGITWTPVDTPMTEFGGLWPGYVSGAHHGVTPPGYGHEFLKAGDLRKGHIYSLVMYSNFRTNFINSRPGEMLVRYALGAHAGDWRAGRAREFGWNAANPPVAVWMKGPKPGTLPPSASFCQVEPSNAMLLALKRAEDGDGFIVRLLETEGHAAEASVRLPGIELRRAYETDVVERNRGPLTVADGAVTVSLKPWGIATVRVA